MDVNKPLPYRPGDPLTWFEATDGVREATGGDVRPAFAYTVPFWRLPRWTRVLARSAERQGVGFLLALRRAYRRRDARRLALQQARLDAFLQRVGDIPAPVISMRERVDRLVQPDPERELWRQVMGPNPTIDVAGRVDMSLVIAILVIAVAVTVAAWLLVASAWAVVNAIVSVVGGC